jgi:hypothetical protein
MKTANQIEVKGPTEALRLIRTAELASKLIEEGYEFERVYDMVLINKPGRLAFSYQIDLYTGECDCPDFINRGTYCKHTLCWAELESERAMWEAICKAEEKRKAEEF